MINIMKHSWIIVFTGLLGTGKTTLSKQVSGILDIPLIAKDAIKEIMYDTTGWSDKEFSGKLARATFGIMEYVIEEHPRTGRSIVIEGNYSPQIVCRNLGTGMFPKRTCALRRSEAHIASNDPSFI